MRVFVTSDQHFDHANFLHFSTPSGEKARPFETLEEMTELMVERWNKKVRPQDKVYQCGDFWIGKSGWRMVELATRLNGKKVLIKGNHDVLKAQDYLKAFKDIRSMHRIGEGFILTHVPLHPTTLIGGKRNWINAHGHTHHRVIEGPYVNVCVEKTEYAPLALDELIERGKSCL